jgi:hypothetical protein
MHMTNHTYQVVYMAVRHSQDGYDWTDVRTASGHPDVVRQNVERKDAEIPQWAKANQFVRVARFQLVEN